MASDPDPISVLFYRASVLEKATKRTTQADWTAALRKVAGLPLEERTHDEGRDVYEAHTDGTGDIVIVGAHRAINTDFMTQIDTDSGSIRDVLDEDSALSAQQFAHTTVMAFLPRHNAVAVARGGSNAPRQRAAVETFLTRHLPQERGQHWHVEAIIAPPQTDELRKAKGVLSLEARYETLRLLDSLEPAGGGIASYLDRFAGELGGEVIVDVKVRIAKDSKNGGTARRFKDILVNDLPRLRGGKKPVQARVVHDDDRTELLDLVERRLATTIELGEDHVSSRRYSAPLEGLRGVSAEMQNRVNDILGE